MNKIMKMALASLFAFAFFNSAHAQNVTEFGIEGDLTVLGTSAASATDPDVEIKGFTVFGATQAAPALNIPFGDGNIFVNGYVEISSGMYVTGSSTFTARVKLPDAASIFVNDGALGEVLKKAADGSMVWAADNDGGAAGLTGTALRLLMIEADGIGTVPSMFRQNAEAGTNITMISGSSMTILGDGTNGLGVSGATKLGGTLAVTGASSLSTLGTSGAAIFQSTVKSSGTFTVGEANETNFVVNAANGNTTIAGTLAVTGKATLAVSSFTAGAANIFISDGGIGQVLKKIAGGAMVWAADNTGAEIADVTGTPNRISMFDSDGVGLVNSFFLQNPTNVTLLSSSMTVQGAFGATGAATLGGTLGVSGLSSLSTLGTSGLATLNSASITTTLGVTGAAIFQNTVKSSGTFTVGEANETNFVVTAANGNTTIAGTLAVTGATTLTGNLIANGNNQLGNAAEDYHGINTAATNGIALKIQGDTGGDNALEVIGGAVSADYAAKFYSGANLAAWIKRK